MEHSIEFLQVSKKYRIGTQRSVRKSIFEQFRLLRSANYHWAIKDISFTLDPGASLGIIGPNGAGKTTILKMLSQVTFPTYGKIQLNGRFSALIELGAGFHPDLTGRENIFLNGTILGMRRHEIKSRFDQIVEFAGIEEYLDTPVKRYSSGMYARLGFSVAAHVDPEILLVDEVLAVGDMAFRKKCYERMLNLINNGTTLVFVSHDFGAVQKVCKRCFVLYKGGLAFDGTAVDATAEYSNILRIEASKNGLINKHEEKALSHMVMTHEAVIEDVQMIGDDGLSSLSFKSGERVRIRMTVRFSTSSQAPIFACTVRLPDGQIVYDLTTDWMGQPTPIFLAGQLAQIEWNIKLNLLAGTYQIGVDLAYGDLSCYYDRLLRALDFVVTGGNGAQGIANLDASFHVSQVQEAEA